jgi:RNA polymerase sigma factor (sigma-70 family)
MARGGPVAGPPLAGPAASGDHHGVQPEHPSVTPAALATLVENQRQFLRFLERRVGDRATAEDLLQDAFARAVTGLEGLRDEESAVAWFYRMLRNAVIDHYRRGGSSKRALEAFARELDEVVPSTEVHDQVCACVSRLAGTLKPEYAEVLREVEVGGRSLKDYADGHGITSNNAAVRVHRARQALRKQVVAACGVCADHGCVDCRCRHDGAGHGP